MAGMTGRRGDLMAESTGRFTSIPGHGRALAEALAMLVLRLHRIGAVKSVAMMAVVAVAAAATYVERARLGRSLGDLAPIGWGWVLAGFAAELLSMLAFGQLQRVLLHAAGARLTLRSVLATAYRANVFAVSVPVVGSSIATGYAFRDFRRGGADAGQASVALTVAGAFSTVAFVVLVAVGAFLTGNPAAAAGALACILAGAAVVIWLLRGVRDARARARIVTLAHRAMVVVRRAMHGRPRRDVAAALGTALELAGELRLGYRGIALALACALTNWAADVGCLTCALYAVGVPVPWAKILLVWSAGAGAASFSPVPGGIGVVDAVLIAALVGVGVRAPAAVAATLLYRILAFKLYMSVIWFAHRFWQLRRARVRQRAASPPSVQPGPHIDLKRERSGDEAVASLGVGVLAEGEHLGRDDAED
jgi:uncharacterized protein (TIRG00374 family)